MSPSLPDTLAQKALTVSLSLALRLVILPLFDYWLNTIIRVNEGVLCLKQSAATPETTSKIGSIRRCHDGWQLA